MMRLYRLLLATALAQTAALLMVSLAPAPAEACSPPLPPDRFYTFHSTAPGDGATGVPVDGVVLLVPIEWRVTNATREVDDSFERALSVTVTDTGTGEPVAGQLRWWGGALPGMTWKANSPLQPNRTYALVGTLQQVHARPENAQGATEVRRTFTTGAQAAPPLELLGGLSVRLERFETDKLDCGSDSCGCTVVGRELATRALIQLPGVRGGTGVGGYRHELWVTDRTPHRFDDPNPGLGHEVSWGVWGASTPGTAAETSFQMPRPPYDKPYTPCFAWRAVDAAGNTVEGAPVCLTEKVPVPGAREPLVIDWVEGDGIIGEKSASGCASTGQGPGGTVALALLGLVATLWRSRALRRARR